MKSNYLELTMQDVQSWCRKTNNKVKISSNGYFYLWDEKVKDFRPISLPEIQSRIDGRRKWERENRFKKATKKQLIKLIEGLESVNNLN